MTRILKCLSIVLALSLLIGLIGCSKLAEPAPELTPEPTPEPQIEITTEEPSTPEDTVLETAPEMPTLIKTAEPVIIAEQIIEGVSFLLDDEELSPNLAETGYKLSRYIYSSQTLTVESEKPFSALYIKWDPHPGTYSLSWDGGSLDCGADGFLHEYVRLPEAVNSVSFTFNEDDTQYIKELGVYTYGLAPDGVQDWLPPCETADILVFPTHADDDTLFFGPVISYYAIEKGLTVQTAFMTSHYSEPYRDHERLDGLWAMGIRHYPIVGDAPDYYAKTLSDAANYHGYDAIFKWQVSLIRRFKPQVILGHDLDGEYGHGQHKLNAYCLVQAVDMAADAEQYPESAEQYGTWDTPKLYLHLYEENQIIFDVHTPLDNDEEGRTPFKVAQDAYKCHVSQQQYYFAVTDSDPEMDCTLFGLYRTLVGDDTGSDIMENIVNDN